MAWIRKTFIWFVIGVVLSTTYHQCSSKNQANAAPTPVADTQPDTYPHGFFENNWVIVELVAVPMMLFMIAMALASPFTYETIKTRHTDFWGHPTGYSYTSIPVSKTPSSDQEIKASLKSFLAMYIGLRFTLLFWFLNVVYMFIGSLIDILFR